MRALFLAGIVSARSKTEGKLNFVFDSLLDFRVTADSLVAAIRSGRPNEFIRSEPDFSPMGGRALRRLQSD